MSTSRMRPSSVWKPSSSAGSICQARPTSGGPKVTVGVTTRNAGPVPRFRTPAPPGPMGQQCGRNSASRPSNGCSPRPGGSGPGRLRTYQANPCSLLAFSPINITFSHFRSTRDSRGRAPCDLFGGERACSRPVQAPEPTVASQPGPVHEFEGELDQVDLDRGQRRPGHRVGRQHVPDEAVKPPRRGRALALASRPRGDEPGLDQPGQPPGYPLRHPLPERFQGRCPLDTSHFHIPMSDLPNRLTYRIVNLTIFRRLLEPTDDPGVAPPPDPAA